MLSEDYEEQYFRAENDLVTNEQEFYVKKDGSVIYTTPIFKTSAIIDTSPAFTGGQWIPKMINIVFDSIVLYVTNPLVEAYLPLKIRFNTKPQLEFSDVTSGEVVDYTLQVDPEINLQTISNYRFKNPLTYMTPNTPGTTVIDEIDQLVVSRDYIYWNAFDGTITNVYRYEVPTGNTVTYPLPPDEVVLVEGNDTLVVGVTATTPADPMDPSTFNEGLTIYDITDGVPVLIVSLPDESLVSLSIIDNQMYLFTNVTLSGDSFLRVYQRDGAGTSLVYEKDVLFSDLRVVDVYRPRRYAGLYAQDIGGNPLQFLYDFGIVNDVDVIIREIIVDNGQYENYVDDPPFALFAGGSDINDPSISIFRRIESRPGVLFWDFFERINATTGVFNQASQSFEFVQIPQTKEFPIADNVNPVIRKFKNTAYWASRETADGPLYVYFANLDNFTFTRWNPRNFTESVNRPKRAYDIVEYLIQRVAIGDNFMVLGGRDLIPSDGTNAVFTVYDQVRDTSKVYKLSYNYDERVYPYIHSLDRLNIEFELPNRDTIDEMEIFKYVIDYRIRYTKDRQEINPATLLVKDDKVVSGKDSKVTGKSGKSKNFVREDNSVGGVDRILGYVDSSFSVQDFLNIYTN